MVPAGSDTTGVVSAMEKFPNAVTSHPPLTNKAVGALPSMASLMTTVSSSPEATAGLVKFVNSVSDLV